ncbi:unnamed protein product [Polarella glacialis]|uniref:Glycosyl hydrolase family 32 N-terminal domain-containing protein n=1 Tax=Polarella glacialis TaxID=89957 RepID=A0A813IVP6_POLGL|nr:unnamed protein product [Polarella glacialis]CAE8658506.1 unnamed protein product [Polarella glacialis]
MTASRGPRLRRLAAWPLLFAAFVRTWTPTPAAFAAPRTVQGSEVRSLQSSVWAPRASRLPRRATVGVQPVLAPGSEGPTWWDARNSASPVVLPPADGAGESKWRMWYYGRAGTLWARGAEAFLPTGRVGTACSEDGISWSRVNGPLSGGACFDPSSEDGAFDNVHVGVGDVVRLPNGTLWMYYFGGGEEEVMPGKPGLKMQIGLAASGDGGLSWERLKGGEPILPAGEPGSFDALFVAWPRVLQPWETASVTGIPDGKWYMSYHTAQFGEGGMKWSAGAAFSDDGVAWEKAPGPVLGPSDGADLWDAQGVGVRSVAPLGDGKLAMLYEAVDAQGDHAVGLAESSDGVKWLRQEVPGASAPGGPVFAKGASGSWDSRVVGTPYVVRPTEAGGAWRLYYVGESTAKKGMSIGLAETSELRSGWRKVGGVPPAPPSGG